MESVYVAQGRGGLLKIGKTANLKKRIHGLKQEFRAKGDDLLRIEACEEVHDAHGPEYGTCCALADDFERHSGREWFKGVDFDQALAVAKAKSDMVRAKQVFEHSPEGIAQLEKSEAKWKEWRAQQIVREQQWEIERLAMRAQCDRRAAERRRRKTGALVDMAAYLGA